jgi:hypothetical protein
MGGGFLMLRWNEHGKLIEKETSMDNKFLEPTKPPWKPSYRPLAKFLIVLFIITIVIAGWVIKHEHEPEIGAAVQEFEMSPPDGQRAYNDSSYNKPDPVELAVEKFKADNRWLFPVKLDTLQDSTTFSQYVSATDTFPRITITYKKTLGNAEAPVKYGDRYGKQLYPIYAAQGDTIVPSVELWHMIRALQDKQEALQDTIKYLRNNDYQQSKINEILLDMMRDLRAELRSTKGEVKAQREWMRKAGIIGKRPADIVVPSDSTGLPGNLPIKTERERLMELYPINYKKTFGGRHETQNR